MEKVNVENRKVFIIGLQEWHNKLVIRKNDVEEEHKDARTGTDRKFYLMKRIDKINDMILNIKAEIKTQRNDSKHYIGV